MRAMRAAPLVLMGLLCSGPAAAEDALGYELIGSAVGPPQLGVISLSFSGTSVVNCSLPAEVGSVGQSAWGTALSPTGQLYALDVVNDRLLLIDTANGAASPAVNLDLDIGSPSDLAFDDSGQLWLAAGTSLFTIDPATGATAVVGEIGEEVEKLTAQAGSLYGASGARLLEIDPGTGQATLVRDYNEPWGGAEFWALASDGQNLWAIMHGWGEVGPNLTYEVAIIDPATGDQLDFRSFDLPQDEPFALEVVRQQQAPAVPATTLTGSVLLVVLLASAGLAFAFLMPQGERRLSSRITLPACVARYGGYGAARGRR